ncbi:hypothetical protein D3C85_1294620 [compost metagenome]
MTMAPAPWVRMGASTARLMFSEPSRLTSRASRNGALSPSSTDWKPPWEKALLISASIRPNCSRVFAAKRWQASTSVMSVGTHNTSQVWGSAKIRCCASSSRALSRAPMATARAPSRAASMANLIPNPGPTPETITTLSFNSMGRFLLLL